ncbi:MAG: glycosyltransferase family 2 protein [Planctomycetes bacterium]|nr:glycosyltransferase family 2 protein [Planctomycetota bacterium]
MQAGDRPAPRAVAPRTEAKRRVTGLTIVVPAKNESAGLGALLAELETVLGSCGVAQHEVLVIDDGSSDRTPEIAAAAGARVISHPESLGNGAAVKRGIREARLGWVLLLDGDGQHPPEAIPEMLALAERYDMVVGSRGGAGGATHRNLANRLYNALASYVTNRPIPDLTSGFRLMRADVVKGFCYLLPNTFSYPTTITLAMLRVGYSVAFLPIRVRPRQGRSHIRLLRDGSRFLLIIMRIAVFFAPLRVFVPLAALLFALGVCWYAYTFATGARFTNMGLLLFTQATVVFALGLISEQVAALRFQRTDPEPHP